MRSSSGTRGTVLRWPTFCAMRHSASMVRHHHERLDGSGYPDALRGEEIPLGARIIAVADTFDAITSERPYRHASAHKKAIDILRAEAAAGLDPDVVRAFCGHYAGRTPIAMSSFVVGLPERAISWLSGSAGAVATATKVAAVAALVGGAALTSSTIGAAAPRHRTSPPRPRLAAAVLPAHALIADSGAGSRPLAAPVPHHARAVSRRRHVRSVPAARPAVPAASTPVPAATVPVAAAAAPVAAASPKSTPVQGAPVAATPPVPQGSTGTGTTGSTEAASPTKKQERHEALAALAALVAERHAEVLAARAAVGEKHSAVEDFKVTLEDRRAKLAAAQAKGNAHPAKLEEEVTKGEEHLAGLEEDARKSEEHLTVLEGEQAKSEERLAKLEAQDAKAEEAEAAASTESAPTKAAKK